MKIVELTYNQFDEFAKFHPLNNYCQTSKYAIFMSESGYSYDYIGLIDDNNAIKAAALILTKRLSGRIKYGYSPKGFLVNYYDQALLKEFLNLLKDYYTQKGFAFIKFNPEIIIGETERNKSYGMSYNGNVKIIDTLKNLNIKRRAELNEFELLQPKFNCYLDLKNFDLNKLNITYRKKIKKAINYGMNISVGDVKKMDVLYNMLPEKNKNSISYYRNFYNVFSKDNSVDLVFINLDLQKYLTGVREAYEREQLKNDRFNEAIQQQPSRKKLNRKMDSDKKLQHYKDEIVRATAELKKHSTTIVAGALIIKHFNRISIVASGFNKEYHYLNPNHFLYYAIIERYKPYFNYFDIGGVSGKYTKDSKYYGLNSFKTKFNPKIYEFIGEFDFICDEHIFKRIVKTNVIEQEFKR